MMEDSSVSETEGGLLYAILNGHFRRRHRRMQMTVDTHKLISIISNKYLVSYYDWTLDDLNSHQVFWLLY